MPEPSPRLPTIADVRQAAARIAGHAHVTPVQRSRSLDDLAGCELLFKCENLQRAGAFKFRGACNAVLALDDASARTGVVTQSSGNHGAAIALACKLRGIPATVVVPEGAPQSKLDAIVAYGARLVRCAPGMAARDAAVADILARDGGTLIHPFDNADVIAGQGTAALELFGHIGTLDVLMTPVGGGGLLSGSALVARAQADRVEVLGAEPEGARDAHDALEVGHPITDRSANTVCDGLRGHLAQRTYDLLERNIDGILLADDAAVLAAMRLVWTRMKLLIEPSSAVPLACVLANPQRFRGRRVGIILSGGNVDPAMTA
ncbi:MAG: pyridoxal-phosphate dependent enzyme [Proteobacteria bacterium]|nr:pyridoxal-phosphate dependent enzyme [Pseudomonadota bacterium]